MFQIITFSPIIFPLSILTSRISTIIKNSKLKIEDKFCHKNKRRLLVYGIITLTIGYSTIYTFNTIAFNHSMETPFDASYQIQNPAYYYSNLGYLWISNYGYDEVISIIRNYSSYTVYIDDDHPRFSYIYYFWIRNFTLFISDWNYENKSLFVIYKFPNFIWEAFEKSPKDDILQNFIQTHYQLIFENENIMIYVNN